MNLKLKIFPFLFLAGALFGADKIVTRDPTTGRQTVTSIAVTSNQISTADSVTAAAVVGVTTSAGAADSGKIPKLNPSGLIDSTMTSSGSSVILTNSFLTTEIAATANTWTNLVSITFPYTSGMVLVTGSVDLKSKDSTVTAGRGARLVQIVGGSTNTVVETGGSSGSQSGPALQVRWVGTLSATNTFIIQGSSVTGGAPVVWGGTAKDYYMSPVGTGTGGTNGTSLSILRITP